MRVLIESLGLLGSSHRRKGLGNPPSSLARMQEGVSPIIAIILLVAITVVIASVLYILVSGYLRQATPAPLNIELAYVSYGRTVTAPFQFYVNFSSITASTGLKTTDFGFKITSFDGSAIPFKFVTLTSAQGVILGIYYPGNMTWTNSVTFPQGDSLSFDTGALDLQGSGAHITAFGLGSSLVSGGYSDGL